MRFGAPEEHILVVKGNLATSYAKTGRHEEALRMRRDAYSGSLEVFGQQHLATFGEAYNYALLLMRLKRFEEAKSLLHKTIPAAQRVLGESHELSLKLRGSYAHALNKDEGATLDDLRGAATTLEDIEQTARQVLGSAHPLTVDIGRELRESRAALRARTE